MTPFNRKLRARASGTPSRNDWPIPTSASRHLDNIEIRPGRRTVGPIVTPHGSPQLAVGTLSWRRRLPCPSDLKRPISLRPSDARCDDLGFGTSDRAGAGTAQPITPATSCSRGITGEVGCLSYGRAPLVIAPPDRASRRPRTARSSGRSRPILRGAPGEASVTDRLLGDAIDGVKDSRVSGAGSVVSTTRVARSADRVAGEAVRMRIPNRDHRGEPFESSTSTGSFKHHSST